MLHINVRYQSEEEDVRIWFAQVVSDLRSMCRKGYREHADGMLEVLHYFVDGGNLLGTKTGDQMSNILTALEGCIQRNFDKEMNDRERSVKAISNPAVDDIHKN